MRSRWQAFGNVESDSNDESRPQEGDSMSVPHAERQLHVYDTLREEILTNIKVTLRQNTRGIALIVIIAGYSLQFGPQTVLAVIPGILGYLFIRNAETQVWMATQARHIVEIEQRLSSQPDSPFRYEIRRGGLLGADQDGLKKYKNIPSICRIAIAGVAYIASVLYVIRIVWPNGAQQIAGITVSSTHLLLTYGALTVAVVITAVATLIYRRKIQKEALDRINVGQ